VAVSLHSPYSRAFAVLSRTTILATGKQFGDLRAMLKATYSFPPLRVSDFSSSGYDPAGFRALHLSCDLEIEAHF
jgi:hypothetical protein